MFFNHRHKISQTIQNILCTMQPNILRHNIVLFFQKCPKKPKNVQKPQQMFNPIQFKITKRLYNST